MIYFCVLIFLIASAPLFLFLRPPRPVPETMPQAEPDPVKVPASFGLEASRNG